MACQNQDDYPLEKHSMFFDAADDSHPLNYRASPPNLYCRNIFSKSGRDQKEAQEFKIFEKEKKNAIQLTSGNT